TTPARPGESTRSRMTTGTSKMQETTSASNPGNPPSTSATSPTTGQGISPTSKPGDTPPTSVVSPTAVQGTIRTSKPGNPPSILTTLLPTVQGTTSTNNPGNSPLAPTTSPRLSQQVSSSTSSRASAATPAATSSVAQQKTSPPASLGSSTATTAASTVSIHVNSPPATSGSLGASVTSTPRVEAQGSQSSEQLTRTTASTQVPVSSLPPGFKGYGVSSPTSDTKQPHSSTSSPVQRLASSTRPGSINASVTSFGGSLSPTTSKAAPFLPSGNISKVSEAATTLTPRPEQTSHGAGPVSTKPASADRSPTSTQPSAPAPGNQTASSSPGHQHPNASFQNEVICKDQVQNNQPTIYLKEAKTCAEWVTASTSTSFFESFCSTSQRAFNASRETCTVTLTSHEPRSQHWAVRAVVHSEYDPTIPPGEGRDGTGIGDPGAG
ncbi:PODXL protein, partial [Cochlearius cochlearius]|nr:PODXL protein [Cochlearius cochlearius]